MPKIVKKQIYSVHLDLTSIKNSTWQISVALSLTLKLLSVSGENFKLHTTAHSCQNWTEMSEFCFENSSVQSTS